MKQNCKFLGASLDVLIKESETDEQLKKLLVLVRTSKKVNLSNWQKAEIDAKLNNNNDRNGKI